MGKSSGAELVITPEFIQIVSKILFFFNGNIKKAHYWITHPNLNLGGIPPLKLMVMGRGHKVLQFIQDAAEEGGWEPREWTISASLSFDEDMTVVEGPQLTVIEGLIRVREVSPREFPVDSDKSKK